MSAAMTKLTSVISKSNTVAIFINQVREKIGVMYGNPETTPGGRALKFYASVRIEVRKGEKIVDGGEIIGYTTKCKVVKNKVAPPFKETQFDMIFGEGISRLGEIITMGEELGFIKKSGAWYSYNGESLICRQARTEKARTMPTLQNRRQKTSLWKSAMRPQRQTLPHLLPLPRKRVRQRRALLWRQTATSRNFRLRISADVIYG